MFRVLPFVLSLFLVCQEQAQAFSESRAALPAHAATAALAALEYGYGLSSGSVAQAADDMDAALLLILGQNHVPPRAVHVLSRESRLAPNLKEVYPFLRLHLTLPAGFLPADLVAQLRAALASGGSSVHLVEEGPELYFAVAAGSITHSLRLLPSPLPESSAAPTPEPRTPLVVYPEAPRLTLIIDDLGENLTQVRQVLALPFPVSTAIIPGTEYSSYASTLLHDNGVEVLIHQPMQAMYDTNMDPAAPSPVNSSNKAYNLLRVGMEQQQISTLLRRSLAQVPDAVGLNNHEGSRFTKTPTAVETFCASLHTLRPDLFVLDSLTYPSSVLYEQASVQGFQAFERTHFLDDAIIRGKLNHKESLAAVRAELEKALQYARLHGRAIAIGHPLPATLEVLREWQGWQNGVVIRPLLP